MTSTSGLYWIEPLLVSLLLGALCVLALFVGTVVALSIATHRPTRSVARWVVAELLDRLTR